MAELSIILVNYRGAADTAECVRSLRLSSYRSFEIFIVENGSGDRSADILAHECPEAMLLVNDVNLGFAGGNNVGIRRALDGEYRYILLLNNDTVVEPDTLKELIQTAEHDTRIGIVGPKIRYFDRPDTLWFAGGYFNPDSGFGRHAGIDKIDTGAFDTETRCDFVSGCCLLARREVFENVGLLAQEYFAYYEDADFCMRAERAGYTVVYQPKSVLYHKVNRSTSWDSPLYLYFNLRNKIIFLRRNSRPLLWFPYVPQLFFFYARQFLRLIVQRRGSPSLRAAWFGLIDGLLNNTGEFGAGRLNIIMADPRSRTA
jgi:GT2 family glycosyltransferase